MIGRFDVHLRAVAARICDADAMDRVIDPTIADFRLECDEAAERWRQLWLHVAVVGALGQVIIVCAFERFFVTSDATDGTEHGSLGRVLTLSAIATVAALVLFVVPPLAAVASRRGWRIVIFLVPQAIPIAVPIGLTLGVFCSARTTHRSPKVARQLALIAATAAVASFITLSWIIPAANQAFRESAFEQVLKAGWGGRCAPSADGKRRKRADDRGVEGSGDQRVGSGAHGAACAVLVLPAMGHPGSNAGDGHIRTRVGEAFGDWRRSRIGDCRQQRGDLRVVDGGRSGAGGRWNVGAGD